MTRSPAVIAASAPAAAGEHPAAAVSAEHFAEHDAAVERIEARHLRRLNREADATTPYPGKAAGANPKRQGWQGPGGQGQGQGPGGQGPGGHGHTCMGWTTGEG